MKFQHAIGKSGCRSFRAALALSAGITVLAVAARQSTLEASQRSVPGGTDDLPGGAWVEAKNRASGSPARPGCLPPCSGGKGNTFFADVKAIDGSAYALAPGRITLGRF